MPRYLARVRSPWEVTRAFDYLVDLEHFADWDPGVKRATRVACAASGDRDAFDVTVSAAGRDLTLRYELADVDAPRRLEARAETATMRSVDVITFEPDGDRGCRVTYDAHLSFRGPLRVADPLLAIAFRRIGDRAAGGLATVLEGVAG